MLVAISMLGVLLHILMDLPTSYGTRLLSPFDWRWFAFDWLPIVDSIAGGIDGIVSRTLDISRGPAAVFMRVAALP